MAIRIKGLHDPRSEAARLVTWALRSRNKEGAGFPAPLKFRSPVTGRWEREVYCLASCAPPALAMAVALQAPSLASSKVLRPEKEATGPSLPAMVLQAAEP